MTTFKEHITILKMCVYSLDVLKCIAFEYNVISGNKNMQSYNSSYPNFLA